MDIQAVSKYVRISPRKLELLVRSIKHLKPKVAVDMLSFSNKSGAEPLKKVILSAVANARNKNIASVDELVFKHIVVFPGSAMKRYQAVSRGMAHEYKKRMSHVKVVLTEKPVEKTT